MMAAKTDGYPSLQAHFVGYFSFSQGAFISGGLF